MAGVRIRFESQYKNRQAEKLTLKRGYSPEKQYLRRCPLYC
jgi:hypothetical protein